MALDRSRATEDALSKLRAELSGLESGAAFSSDGFSRFSGGPGGIELGTSIDDLARLHEGHASNMREFGRALRDVHDAPPPSSSYQPSSSLAPPLPSDEPDFGLTGRRIGGGAHSAAAMASASGGAAARRRRHAQGWSLRQTQELHSWVSWGGVPENQPKNWVGSGGQESGETPGISVKSMGIHWNLLNSIEIY